MFLRFCLIFHIFTLNVSIKNGFGASSASEMKLLSVSKKVDNLMVNVKRRQICGIVSCSSSSLYLSLSVSYSFQGRNGVPGVQGPPVSYNHILHF